MRQGLTAFALVAVVSLVAAACTSDDGDLASPEPWRSPVATWMQPAGTPLTSELVVPEGSQLIGPVFATSVKRSRSDSSEWRVTEQSAIVQADSDVVVVTKDLVDQSAGAFGREAARSVSAGTPVGSCDQGGAHGQIGALTDVDPDAEVVQCTVAPQGPAPEDEFDPGWERQAAVAGRQFHFRMSQTIAKPSDPILGTAYWAVDILVPESFPVAPTDVSGPDSVPGIVDYPDLQIVGGSFLAAPLLTPADSEETYSYTAVIGVSGDPDEVFDAYADQAPDQDPFVNVDRTVGDLHFRQFKSAEAGGVWFSVTMNVLDGHAWILLDVSEDT